MRATGRTTRQIDIIIQSLFNGVHEIVEDHYGTKQSDRYLMEGVVKRLQNEHPNTEYIIDRGSNRIKLKQ